jgi:hypothetical protein
MQQDSTRGQPASCHVLPHGQSETSLHLQAPRPCGWCHASKQRSILHQPKSEILNRPIHMINATMAGPGHMGMELFCYQDFLQRSRLLSTDPRGDANRPGQLVQHILTNFPDQAGEGCSVDSITLLTPFCARARSRRALSESRAALKRA